MNVWSRARLAGMLCAVTLLAAGAAAAAPGVASPGFAEITVPDGGGDVAIVPRPDPHRDVQDYAIETVPDHARRRSEAPHVLASLPAGPPLAIDIRFDPQRSDNADRARQVAAALGRDGLTVRTIGPGVTATTDDVGFVFAEDAAAASHIAHDLAGLLGHATETRLDAHHMNDALPGTIMITLGSERGTS